MQHSKKTQNLHIRLTEQQYENIKNKATELGISMSDYILRMSEQGKIVVIEPKNLAEEIQKLNLKLSKLEKFPVIKAQELRDIIGNEIIKLNEILKNGG